MPSIVCEIVFQFDYKYSISWANFQKNRRSLYFLDLDLLAPLCFGPKNHQMAQIPTHEPHLVRSFFAHPALARVPFGELVMPLFY